MITIGIQNNNLYVIVEGKGTAEYCSELDKYLKEIFSSQMTVNHVYFDTKKACYLDSSFIGMILSIKKKNTNNSDIVSLLNPSDKIIEIFQIMGLDSYVPAVYNDSLVCENCNIEVSKKLENTISDIKLLLDSHRNIMETSPENHKKFMLVEKVFQKELKQRQYSN